MKIEGGYYIKARQIEDSDIASAPPHVREIWDWLIRKASHKDTRICKRGELFTTYKDIQDGLSWKVGYRTERYTKWQCERAMKVLTNAGMIVVTKTTRGMLIKIDRYDVFQNPENYESHTRATTKATREPQGADTINKNGRIKKEEHTHSVGESLKGGVQKNGNQYTSLTSLTDKDFSRLAQETSVSVTTVEGVYQELVDYCESRGKKYKNYYATMRSWIRKKIGEGRIVQEQHLSVATDEKIEMLRKAGMIA